MFRPITLIISIRLLGVILILLSCRKQAPICISGCSTLNINGRLYDKINNVPFKDVPISAIWFRNGYCIGCTSYHIVSGKTDATGSFNLSRRIDTNFFKDHHIVLRIENDTNYILPAQLGVEQFIEYSMNDFDPSGFQNLQIGVYPKAYLTLRMQRRLNDNFDYFGVEHSFSSRVSYSDITIPGTRWAKDTIRVVPTAAGIYTKIFWSKKLGTSQTSIGVDSIICNRGVTNQFVINY